MTRLPRSLSSSNRVAVLQSNYIPWKGYFDLIGNVDIVVIYDQMQYTREDWRNRNIIKAPNGLMWLTVPIHQSGRFGQRICDAEIVGTQWARKHWKAFESAYRRAPYYDQIAQWLSPIYSEVLSNRLSILNRSLIEAICAYLGIETQIVDSSQLELDGDRSERVAHICSQLGANCYVSGPAARSYLDETVFSSRGITVEWFDYSNYVQYRQLWGEFFHRVSVLDLLFMCGSESPSYMKFSSLTHHSVKE